MVHRHRRNPVQITVPSEELAQRYLAGASLDDLGILCGGCTGARIRRLLVDQGVEIRPRGYNPGNSSSTKFTRR
jgi:hypothetical protein